MVSVERSGGPLGSIFLRYYQGSGGNNKENQGQIKENKESQGLSFLCKKFLVHCLGVGVHLFGSWFSPYLKCVRLFSEQHLGQSAQTLFLLTEKD